MKFQDINVINGIKYDTYPKNVESPKQKRTAEVKTAEANAQDLQGNYFRVVLMNLPLLDALKKRICNNEKNESEIAYIKSSIKNYRYRVPLEAKSSIIESTKISIISKPNKVEAVVPDFSKCDEILPKYGFVKDGDNWYAQNREWFPRPINENDIIVIYSRDKNGEPDNVGFCSKSEFSRLYTDSSKYEEGITEFIDAESLPKGN